MKLAHDQKARKERKLVRMFERTGMNTTPLTMSKAGWIKFNVMYANFFK